MTRLSVMRRHPQIAVDCLAVIGACTVLAGIGGAALVIAIDAGRKVRAGRREVGA